METKQHLVKSNNFFLNIINISSAIVFSGTLHISALQWISQKNIHHKIVL